MSIRLESNALPEVAWSGKPLPLFRQKTSALLPLHRACPFVQYEQIANADIANVPLFVVISSGFYTSFSTDIPLIATIIQVDGYMPTDQQLGLQIILNKSYRTNNATITLFDSADTFSGTYRYQITSSLLNSQLDRVIIADRFNPNSVPIQSSVGGMVLQGSLTFGSNLFSINATGQGIIGITGLPFGTPVTAIAELSYTEEAVGQYITFQIQPFEIIYYVELRGEIYLPVANPNAPRKYEFLHDAINNTVTIFTNRNMATGLLMIKIQSVAVQVIATLSYDRPV